MSEHSKDSNFANWFSEDSHFTKTVKELNTFSLRRNFDTYHRVLDANCTIVPSARVGIILYILWKRIKKKTCRKSLVVAKKILKKIG